MSRPLTLHVSALNDAEFARYTASIHDILDSEPPDYDKAAVGVREARAWLRGRYPTLASHTLDSILRLFAPELGAADVLTGGQFFAVLRLVSHVLGGQGVDPSLVFVQAHFQAHKSRPSSPVDKSCQVPTPILNPFSTNGSAKPLSPSPISTVMPTPTKPPPPTLPPKPTNPFLKRRGSQDLPPQSAPAGVGAFGPRTSVPQDAKIPPLPPRKPHVLPPPRHASMNVQHLPANKEVPPVPPLPRNVSVAHTTNSLIQQSLQATRIAQSLKQAEQKLEQERVMEVLRSSSDSSTGSIKRVRSTSPTKNPSSSASSASSSADRTAMRNGVPKLPPRRNLSPPASTAPSARSFEQVATAAVTPHKRPVIASASSNGPPIPPEPPQRRRASSPTRTPPRPLSDLVSDPPPTHPDRKATASNPELDPTTPTSASPRVGRSRSLHHPTPPAPPPRRKRPESVQVTPTSPSPFDSSPFANPPLPSTPPPAANPNMRLSRHLSLSSTKRDPPDRDNNNKDRERERERSWETFSDSPLGASLQKTLSSLSARAAPALDTARYKAEGAFARRGFVQHGGGWMRREGEARLIDDVDGDGGEEGEGHAGVDVDADGEGGLGMGLDHDASGSGSGDGEGVEERARRWRRGGVDVAVVERRGEDGRAGRRLVLERDDLKWPAGEGWRPL
ncbi:hypothetical protein GSI_09660 [Ganoderma sinense ZZ0214-1]|uniref:Uncharacterized protein n=1 Tax=Ganoderma sinense ZZ0214-1 TaxID=1077348 RepID=A0A2G8S3V5_9APHY|nr:hypothetical protein GSI_09660 [Ganoderma sinense ZZ0214-1]